MSLYPTLVLVPLPQRVWDIVCGADSVGFALFGLILNVQANYFSIMSGRVFFGCTCIKQG